MLPHLCTIINPKYELIMKTIKNVVLTGMLMISMASFANDNFYNKDGNVTISQQDEIVQVSILNTMNASYQLYIYSEEGTLIYKGRLGSNISLGKAFDFQTAQKGTYTFKLVTNAGATFVQDVKIG